MVNEFDTYHGIVFSSIIRGASRRISFETYPSVDKASYLLDDKLGLYIKYSTKRMSPWQFSFLRRHQDEIAEMKVLIGRVVLALVCRNEGIVGLTFSELKNILDEQHEENEWISVSRRPREKFVVKGTDGKLKVRIGSTDFITKVNTALGMK